MNNRCKDTSRRPSPQPSPGGRGGQDAQQLFGGGGVEVDGGERLGDSLQRVALALAGGIVGQQALEAAATGSGLAPQGTSSGTIRPRPWLWATRLGRANVRVVTSQRPTKFHDQKPTR